MSTIARLGVLWCRVFHSRISWPINGEYVCWECFRRHRVPWGEPIPRSARNGRLEGV